MADELSTTTTTTAPATETTPATPGNGSETGSGDGVGGKDPSTTQASALPNAELEKLRSDLKAKETLLGHYQRVATHEDPFAPEVLGSTVEVLRASGKTDAEIRAIIESARQEQPDEVEKPTVPEKNGGDDEALASLRKEVEALKGQQNRSQLDRFNGDVKKMVTEVTSSSKEVQELLGVSKKRGLDEGKAREIIDSQVEDVMRASLKRRLELSPPANYEALQEMVQQEAAKAVSVVDGRFRTVIGAPSDLVRAPETAMDSLKELVDGAPKKLPDFNPGVSSADAEEMLDKYIAGGLAGGLMDSNTARSL